MKVELASKQQSRPGLLDGYKLRDRTTVSGFESTAACDGRTDGQKHAAYAYVAIDRTTSNNKAYSQEVQAHTAEVVVHKLVKETT